jgi:restriction endonuclease
VLKNLEITAEHFRALYNNMPFEHFVYDAKRVSRLRQFATSSTLQILVINIDGCLAEACLLRLVERLEAMGFGK